MKKIPTVFVRDFETKPFTITPEVTPGCEWVLAGEGRATRKWDGTCVRVLDGKLYARYDAKHGKTPPEGFEPAQPEADPETGHWPGWLLITDQPQYKWHRDATMPSGAGTYELVGPKINGNPEKTDEHLFLEHGGLAFPYFQTVEPSLDGLKAFLTEHPMEGLVFHHPDGRMAKIKRKDFGLQWPVKVSS
jgi:hypothetical protein